MFEYEYRLSVMCENYKCVLGKLIKRFNITEAKNYTVYYFKPHFRFKNDILEWKEMLSNITVYHDGIWFKLVESEEISFNDWSRNMNLKFLEIAGQYSNPFTIEYRTELKFPGEDRLKVYGFQKKNLSGLVFEFELCNKNQRVADIKTLINDTNVPALKCFKDIYKYFRNKPTFPYTMRECSRKPVVPIHEKDLPKISSSSSSLLVARKYDGVFGFVYSFKDEIREIWEDNQFRLRRGKSLGDGLVFGAERMSNGTVILLDVYQVRGSPIFSTDDLLMEFLPQLADSLSSSRYKVQKYFRNIETLKEITNLEHEPHHQQKKFDGLVFHDTMTDTIYKLKTKHTIDLVHFDGYFFFPDNVKKKVPDNYSLKNGVVYECSLDGLKPLRERVDRFVGNTNKQISKIYRAI